jgi:hypothetical protein
MKDRAAQVLLECAELIERKSADYNNGQDRSVYYPYGDKSLFTMVWTKVMRIKSLIDSDRPTNFESLEDSLKDLANYSAIWVSELEKRK